MIEVSTLSGRSVALFGLGGSGRATALALKAGGADVVAFDDNPASIEAARADGIATADLHGIDWSRQAALILSPGVPLTHPRPHWTADLAAKAGVPIVGDVELFSRERAARAPDAPFVAITGTNGKSTTTALIAHGLRVAGRDTQLGGNIGVAVLTLEPPAPGRFHVVECSSYQIDLAPSIAPSVAILLNLTPDHLDRHGSMEHYAEVKARLLRDAGTAVVGVDDAHCRAVADALDAAGRRVVRISQATELADGVFFDGRRVVASEAGRPIASFDLSGIGSLRGRHNGQNAAAAVAALFAAGLDAGEIDAGLTSFPGLAHRMEEIGRQGRTLFVNDSKATNADAAAPALGAFREIRWIAGGLAKEGGIASLAPLFPHVAKAYLIGEAAPAFAATLGERVPFEISGTLDVAVAHAARDAASAGGEPVVLLSPACASFDQFRNFEVRGAAFREAVARLPGIELLRKGDA